MSYISRRSWNKRSSGLKNYKRKNIFLRIFLNIILFFLVFEIITSIFLTSFRVESLSMEPAILSGSVLVSSPLVYGAEIPFINKKLPSIKEPNRGDIVINTSAFYSKKAWYINIIDSMLSFVSFQRKSFGNNSENYFDSYTVKRIIGIPGDTVKIVKDIAFIKPADGDYFFSEHKIIQTEYKTQSNSRLQKMTENMPLTGNMKELKLKDGEYFLLGDNRSLSNDSYYWGVAPLDSIKAKVLFEYVPEIKMLK